MKKGLHVFIEKPPAPTLNQTKEMLNMSKRTGRKLMVAFMKRFARKYAKAYEISGRKEFGKRTHMLMRYSFPFKMKDDGILKGMGTHPFDLVRHFMGDVKEIHAERNQVNKAITYVVNLKFKNGGSGTIIMSNSCPSVLERMELTGEDAFLVVDEVGSLEYYVKQKELVTSPEYKGNKPNFALQTDDNSNLMIQGYAGEVMEFIDAVKKNRALKMSSIKDGYEAMKIVDIVSKNINKTAKVK